MNNPEKFFEAVYTESKIKSFISSLNNYSRFTEETAQSYYNYLQHNLSLVNNDDIIDGLYGSNARQKLERPLDSRFNSIRKKSEKELRLRNVNSLPWEDLPHHTVDDFVREFTNIVNANIPNILLRLRFLRYMADYVRICGEDEVYKSVKDNIKAQAANL